MGDHAHTLSDFLVPTLSIECEPCGRRGRYNVAKLIEQYGDAKLPELRHILADCPKAKSQSIHDRCKVRYGADSRASTHWDLERMITARWLPRGTPPRQFQTSPAGSLPRALASILRLSAA